MSASESAASDQLIQPAPAQSSVASLGTIQSSVTSVPSETEKAVLEKAKERDDAIKRLNKYLRQIQNVCGPMSEYVKFQQNVNPDVRVLIDLNQWMLLMYGLKSVTKNEIDSQYMDIIEPPESLKIAMESAYDNLDSVSVTVENSIKEIISLVQSRIISGAQPSVSSFSPVCSSVSPSVSPSQPQSEFDVLTSMNSHSRLP